MGGWDGMGWDGMGWDGMNGWMQPCTAFHVQMAFPTGGLKIAPGTEVVCGHGYIQQKWYVGMAISNSSGMWAWLYPTVVPHATMLQSLVHVLHGNESYLTYVTT